MTISPGEMGPEEWSGARTTVGAGSSESLGAPVRSKHTDRKGTAGRMETTCLILSTADGGSAGELKAGGRSKISLEGMLWEPAMIAIPAVLFVATVIRSAFGFGEALIAVPLLALVVPVEVAAPVAVLASITIAFIAVVQDWRKIHFKSAGWLVLSTMAGIPLGLLMLRTVPEAVVKMLLAAVIIGFSTYALRSVSRGGEHGRSGGHGTLHTDGLAWMFGFAAGILGGAYGMNGPPLVIYGSLRGWSPQHFRATLQGYFLPASLAGLWGYRVAGLWTPTVNRYYLLSLPLVIVATLVGRAINRRMEAGRFLRWVHGGLIAVGLVLVAQGVVGWVSRR